MLKKAILFAFVLLLGLLIFASWGIKRIGDIRPAFLLPAKSGPEKAVGELPFNLPEGFSIEKFADGLGSPRDLEFSPEGTLLVSVPSSGKILALRDKNLDGKADEIKEILSNLDTPHGLAFFNKKLFVAEESKITRYDWSEENLSARKDKELFSLPAGERHVTRTIAFGKDGLMFVSIGSTCDVCFEKNPWHATIIVSDSEGNNPRVFAKGLRNSVFITLNNQTSELWGTDMGRDFLGDNLPPDEINIIMDGKNYGWPVCYGNRVYDQKFGQRSPEYCQSTEPPIYEIAAHSAPLGLAFVTSRQFPREWQGDLLVAYHGSWNRSTPIGYKVVRLDVEGEKVIKEYDFIDGFLKDSQAIGRPVDLVFDKDGSLYFSDDKAGIIYKVKYSSN